MAHRLPARSAYPSGDEGDEQRWFDYKRIREGRPPRYASVTESSRPRTPITEEAPAVPEVEVTPAELARMGTEDPQTWRELERAFAEAVFAHHDVRRGQSPFNRA